MLRTKTNALLAIGGFAAAGVVAPAAAAPVAGAAVPASTAAAAAAPKAKAPARRAKACAPSGIVLKRGLGKTTATLRWRAPQAAARSGADPVYRVKRGKAIVGQTSKRAIRVRVALGRTYAFSVTPLNAGGKPATCAAVKRVRVKYRLPATPRGLAVTSSGSGLRATWKKAKRGDSPIAGYRLIRDGSVLGQTRRTRWSLRAAAGRRYRFAIVAVDRAGRTSKPSRSVTATTGTSPTSPTAPRTGQGALTAPTGLSAVAVTDTSLGVSWKASTGPVKAYRVLRNDVVVRQVTGTQLVLENLAPSTGYRISVVAVDGQGRTSAPATVDARTQDPTPTTGHAQAYLLASTDQSFEDFRAHYRQIGVVHPTYYDCRGDAAFVGSDDPLITRWAQARKVEVLPRINCQQTAVVGRIVNDPATRAAWLDRMVSLAREVGYDGISLDFEAGAAADRAAYTSFVAELASRLHADGRKLAVAVSAKTRDVPNHPRSTFYDYAALSEHADYMFLMAWGIHWSTSAPGPQDDINWVRQVVDYVKTMPQKHKFVFGTNLYVLDWPNGGGPENKADAYQYQDIVPRLPELGAQIGLDPATDNWRATYTDANGTPREVWWPDAETTARRVALAKEAGLGGVGFWRLGREDQRIWDNPLLAPGAPW